MTADKPTAEEVIRKLQARLDDDPTTTTYTTNLRRTNERELIEAITLIQQQAEEIIYERSQKEISLKRQIMDQDAHTDEQHRADELEIKLQDCKECINEIWEHMSYPKFGDEQDFLKDFPERRALIESCKPDIRTKK